MMKTAFVLFCLASCVYGAAPSLDESQGVHKKLRVFISHSGV